MQQQTPQAQMGFPQEEEDEFPRIPLFFLQEHRNSWEKEGVKCRKKSYRNQGTHC